MEPTPASEEVFLFPFSDILAKKQGHNNIFCYFTRGKEKHAKTQINVEQNL